MVKTLIAHYPGHMGALSAYYSILSAGHVPHEIHAHDEEEIIVLLSGKLDVLTPTRSYRIGPGSFIFHPPGDRHSIRSVGPAAAAFFIFKWTWENAARTRTGATLLLHNAAEARPRADQAGMQRRRVCEDRPLAQGGRLVADAIHIAPRAGYPAHSHEHDLLLVLLHGRLHGLGHVASAPAAIYYPAGTLHGCACVSADPIDMLAFEFHAPPRTECTSEPADESRA
jgi:quercetin dioxygenase-like cupin family protein